MKKALVVTVVIIGLGLLAFLFIDEPLDDETKAWLDVPPGDNSKGLALLERFNRIAEAHHQGKHSGPSYLEVEEVCDDRGFECILMLFTRLDERRNYLPQDPAYYDTYDALLKESLVGTDQPGVFSALPLSHLAAAPRYVVLNAILNHGGVSPDVVARSIEYSRRMMKESLHWSDSHSFSVMLSKSLIAADMAMGFLHLSVDEVLASSELEAQLRPLTEEERSLVRVGQGNLSRTAYFLENDVQGRQKLVTFLKGNTVLNRERFVAGVVVEHSEFSHESFWSSRLEYPSRSWKDSLMELPRDEVKKNWMDLNFARRNADLMLTVSRALRRTYLGRLPREHGEPPPKFFAWRWRPQTSELCLEGKNLSDAKDPILDEIIVSMRARGVCMENFRFHVSGSITPDP